MSSKTFNKVPPKSISVDKFNSIISKIDKCLFRYTEPTVISGYVYVYNDKRHNIHLVYKDKYTKKVNHYVVDPYTGEEDPMQSTKSVAGRSAYKKLKYFAKKYNEDIDTTIIKNYKMSNDKPKYSYVQYMWYDPNKAYEWLDGIYQYDMNGCYLSFYKKPLPYGDVIRKNSVVKEDEIGFSIELNAYRQNILVAKFAGEIAEMIFKTKEYKCMKHYANYAFQELESVSRGIERDRLKIKIHALIGNLIWHNVFISSAIVGYATKYIKSLKTENSIMCTVDSITNIGPLDLDVGNEIGQFKLEYENVKFYYSSDSRKKYMVDGQIIEKVKGKRKNNQQLYTYNITTRRIEKKWQEIDN